MQSECIIKLLLSSVVVEAVLPQAVAHRHTASTVPTIFNCFSLIFFLFLRCYLCYRTVVFTGIILDVYKRQCRSRLQRLRWGQVSSRHL